MFLATIWYTEMRLPLVLNGYSAITELAQASRLISGNISVALGPNVNLLSVLSELVNFVWARTFLYPNSSILVTSTDPLFLIRYDHGSLFLPITNVINDALFTLHWSPAITYLPTISIDPSYLRELKDKFPGLQTINLNVRSSDIASLIQAQLQYPTVTFRGI